MHEEYDIFFLHSNVGEEKAEREGVRVDVKRG
jgi:hypothetical protein